MNGMDTCTRNFHGVDIMYLDKPEAVDRDGYYRYGIYTTQPRSWTVARYGGIINEPTHAEYVVNTFDTEDAAIAAVEILLA